VVGLQMIIILSLMFSQKMKVYVIYFFLDLIGIIPHLFCMHLFTKYINEDRPVRRSCLPIICCILIVLTGAVFFQMLCMLIKTKSLADASDKMKALPKDTYSHPKPKAKPSSPYSKKPVYVEKPNNDTPDDDTIEVGFGLMFFYMFVQLCMFTFWILTYSAFNQYV
jgi:hypothetical protein